MPVEHTFLADFPEIRQPKTTCSEGFGSLGVRAKYTYIGAFRKVGGTLFWGSL